MSGLMRILFVFGLFLLPARVEAAVLTAESGWSTHRGDLTLGTAGWQFGDAEWKPTAPFEAPQGLVQGDVFWLRIPVPAGEWLQPTLLVSAFEGAFSVWSASGARPQSRAVEAEGDDKVGLSTGFTLVPLVRGDDEVFVRVVVRHAERLTGPRLHVLVGEPSELFAWQAREDLPVLVVVGILLTLALGSFLVFLFFPKVRALAAIAGYSLVNGLVLAGLGETSILVVGSRTASLRFSLPAVGLFVALLCVAIAEANERLGPAWFRRVGQALVGVGLVYAPVAIYDTSAGARWLPFVIVLAMLGMVSAGVVTLRAARAGDWDARALAVGALVFLGSIAWDGLPFITTGQMPLRYTVHLGMLAVTISFAAIAGRKLVMLLTTLEAQTASLGKREGEALANTQRLEEGARSLVEVAGSLRESAEAQTAGLTRQAAALQETQVTAEEIKRTSAMAAEKARGLLTATVEAEEVGRTAESAIDEALSGIEAIGREVAEVARQVAGVEKRASEISGIVATVKELADQSNMLALNAAIVAVRAGEHGRGFSVVAREVRRLADQSVLATERIGKVLDGVAGGVREASGTSQRGATRVAASVEQLRVSTQRLQRVGALSREANAGVRQISAAVTQQNAGVSQIFQAIDDLSKHMNETLERLRDTENSATRVHAVASQMSSASPSHPIHGSAR